ncbi:MAG: potassium transporter TrkG [Pseudomonadota bacterium]
MRQRQRIDRRGAGRGSLFALAAGVLAVSMLVPLIFAMIEGDERIARAFLYAALFTGFSAAIMGVALASGRARRGPESEIVTLLALWLILPCFAAIPLVLLTPSLGWVGAWFEMVASLTTTGSTGYLEPTRVPEAIHLWRAVVSWLGGLLTLTAAYVILAPRRMGGFEVRTPTASAAGVDTGDVRLAELGAETPPVDERIHRAMRTILPVYIAMTVALVMLLGAAQQLSLSTIVHALGIVSTSGVSTGAPQTPHFENIPAEIIAAVFLVLAATARLYGKAATIGRDVPVRRDPELRLMALIVIVATLTLFLRHWTAALELEDGESAIDALSALWGIFFTTLSFLTTTGYEAAAWDSASAWAGLKNPTLLLLGLAAIGGGAATTAGGIKLIRAAALIRHGLREIDRLAQPNVVGGSGTGVGAGLRGLVGEGAFLGWAFIMLYAGAVLTVTLGLATSGLSFEPAFIAAVSAVSNTGPVFGAVAGGHESYALLDGAQRAWIAVGMVVGRMETLAVIALFRRDALLSLLPRRKTTGNTVD